MKHVVTLLAAALACAGCTSLVADTQIESEILDTDDVANAYVSLDGLQPYEGEILRLGLWGHTPQDGEIVSLDVWPLCGVGVGPLGLRLRVLPLELGAGALFYTPEPEGEPVGEIAAETD